MSPSAFSPPTSPLSLAPFLPLLLQLLLLLVAPSETPVSRSSARQTGNSQRAAIPELEEGDKEGRRREGASQDSADWDQPGCLVKKETGQIEGKRRGQYSGSHSLLRLLFLLHLFSASNLLVGGLLLLTQTAFIYLFLRKRRNSCMLPVASS